MGGGAGTLVRGAFLSGAGMLAGLACALGLIKLITNAPGLTSTDIDLYMMVTPASDFLLIVFNLGLRSALPSLLAAAVPERQVRLIRSALFFQLCALALAMVVILALAPFAVRYYPGVPVYAFSALLALLVCCSTLRDIGMAMLAGLHRYAVRSLALVTVPMFHALLFALAMTTVGASLSWLIAAAVAANGLTAGMMLAALPRQTWASTERESLADSFRVALPLYLNSLFTLIFQRLDTLIVGVLCPMGTAGVFEVAAKRVPLYASGLLNAGLAPFLPGISERIARGELEAASRMLQRTYALFAFMAWAGLLFTLVVQRPLLLLISAERYLEGLPALGPVMAATLLMLLAGLMGQSLVALGKPHLVTWTNLGIALMSLAMNALLIPRLGMMGAAAAALLAAIASILVQTQLARQNGLVFPWLLWFKPHALLLVCLALLGVTGRSPQAHAAALLLFVALAFLFRLVYWEELRKFAVHLWGLAGRRA